MSSETLAFKNISLLDSKQFIEKAAIVVKGRKIVFSGTEKEIPEEFMCLQWQDGKGQWVTPGFINGHTHVAMSFMREQAHDHLNMIEEVFFPIEKKLSEEDVYQLSFPSLLAGLQSGVTTFVDHYYHIAGIEKALTDLGLRGFVAETLADLGGAKPARLKLSDVAPEKDWSSSSHQLVRRILGPHAMDTVSNEYMQEISAYSQEYNIPIHMHLSQTKKEYETCVKQRGLSPVETAHSCNALSDKTLAVHLISSQKEDREILQKQNTFVGLCPSSQVLYEHIAPIAEFQRLDLKGILGTDCSGSHDSMDIMQELRFLYLMYRKQGLKVSAKEVLKTVWDHPAEWLGFNAGSLKAGSAADLIFFQRDFSCEPHIDPQLHLIMTMSSRHIQSVMINGRFRLVDQMAVNFDTEIQEKSFAASLKSLGIR